MKQAKFAMVVSIVMIVSGRASSILKLDVSYLFYLKAIVINKYDMFYISSGIFLLLHKECMLHKFKLCILCLHLMADNTVKVCVILLYVNSTTEET